MRSFVRYAIFSSFLVTIIGLLIAQFGGRVDAVIWPYSQLAGLAYPYALIAMSSFTIYYALRKNHLAWLGLLTIISGWPNPVHLFQFSPAEEIQELDIKLLSYNIRLFNKYGWKPDKTVSDQLFEFIHKEEADILCFQEFYHIEKGPTFKSLTHVQDTSKTINYYFEHFEKVDLNKQRFFGLVTFSKYPIINHGNVLQPNFGKAGSIFTDIVINTDTIRVYNIHLKSLGFAKDDYSLLAGNDQPITDKQINQGKGIIRKILEASAIRSNQAIALKAHIEHSPYPVVVAGDFNETPFSFAYQTIAKNLQNGFLVKGNGFGYTYGLTGGVPPLKIDHILVDDAIQIINFNNQYTNLSDHEPVSTILRLPSKR